MKSAKSSVKLKLLKSVKNCKKDGSLKKIVTVILFYHVSLTQEITHFLQADSRSEPVSRLEGLKLLRHSFAENKEQLVELVGRGEGNDVSECDGDETVFIRSENPRSLRTSFEHFETLATSIDDSMNSYL